MKSPWASFKVFLLLFFNLSTFVSYNFTLCIEATQFSCTINFLCHLVFACVDCCVCVCVFSVSVKCLESGYQKKYYVIICSLCCSLKNMNFWVKCFLQSFPLLTLVIRCYFWRVLLGIRIWSITKNDRKSNIFILIKTGFWFMHFKCHMWKMQNQKPKSAQSGKIISGY